MADIYLSYAREDRERARLLAEALAQIGWTVFWDRMISPGEAWRDVIERNLNQSRCFIVLWTAASVESTWVWDEAQFAREQRLLFPVLFEDGVKIPLGFKSIQTANLQHWRGNNDDADFQRLVRDLAAAIGLPASVSTLDDLGADEVARRPLNEGKLTLVGFGGVGKTSLVKRIVLEKPFARDEVKTEGIRITEWDLRLPEPAEAKRKSKSRSGLSLARWFLRRAMQGTDAAAAGQAVRMHVWDFGGQEIMHATHQFFLTTSTLYLLVLNGRQGREDADAEYWLSMIATFASGSPVIVVLNKIKEHPFDLNRRALQAKFPTVRAFVETDCTDDTGLDSLTKTICHEVDRLPHLRDTFPVAWFAVKDRLSEMDASYLSFDDYRKLCEQCGEADPDAQNALASFLHTLGIALNYRDDPRLRDLHVLKPEWVTEGIYAIINSRLLAASNGELELKQLEGILDRRRYPNDRHPFLLELMRKFELCLRFPEDENRFLIPELLDKQDPAAIEAFSAEGLSFEYHYPTLIPEGLLPRFIVRTSALSVGQPRWRSGVVLEFEENRALVKVDATARTIRIVVLGPLSGRRRLLAVIRSDFEHIQRNYAFRPQEIVPVPERPGVAIPYKKLLVLEKEGIDSLQEVYGDELVTVSVRTLLNGVDLEGVRPTLAVPERRQKPQTAFVSFSHKDEPLRAELETHLKLLSRLGLLDIWQDRCITAGSEWVNQIDENLELADLVLLLVSADFLASDYCWDIELKRALELEAAGTTRVIPIIVRTCSWQKAPFGRLQALPPSGKAVTSGSGKAARDKAWTSVAQGIESVLKEIQAK
jgi:internalin A